MCLRQSVCNATRMQGARSAVPWAEPALYSSLHARSRAFRKPDADMRAPPPRWLLGHLTGLEESIRDREEARLEGLLKREDAKIHMERR